MKKTEQLLGYCIKAIELFSVKKAAQLTFKLFQRTQTQKMRESELQFYQSTEYVVVPSKVESVKMYTKGPEEGDLFILLHGWNSNMARFKPIVELLVKQGYRCVLFDMPGHGKSSLNHTNLAKNKIVFEAVLAHLNPQKPFSVLTHSFGSMLASFTLKNTDYKLNHLIFLTALDRFEPIFHELKRRLNLSDQVYKEVVKMGESLLKEPIGNLKMVDMTKQVNYKQLSLLHDRYDKILPIDYSEKLAKNLENTRLFTYSKIGHSRMLYNKDLLNDLKEVVQPKVTDKKMANSFS